MFPISCSLSVNILGITQRKSGVRRADNNCCFNNMCCLDWSLSCVLLMSGTSTNCLDLFISISINVVHAVTTSEAFCFKCITCVMFCLSEIRNAFPSGQAFHWNLQCIEIQLTNVAKLCLCLLNCATKLHEYIFQKYISRFTVGKIKTLYFSQLINRVPWVIIEN